MVPLIIAVKSTFEDLFAGKHDRIRAGWGLQARGKCMVKFFISRRTHQEGVFNVLNPNDVNSYTAKSDEYIIDCPDSRQWMVKKVRGICQYVMDKAASHTLIVDVNHNVDIQAVLNAPYEFADYAGDFLAGFPSDGPGPVALSDETGTLVTMDDCYPWANGDSGYFLSRKAAAEISNTPALSVAYVNGRYDDVWVAQVLGPDIVNGDFIAANLGPVTL